ncbi:unnamed protein product [Bemisia tabaci]|uniref:Sodium/calcium exchanger membrane region domain-containing protein n=1 Tax=Bemisia tabaci TaxID=7038 RepID=A0A9P0A7C2_BEMTA|nr:PREDICTED: sodium/potassium/calcium exchanger 3-like [Bemisia tabaci]CAH0385573.1 unnamed protein product [Bemisia tabaci]
MGSVKLRWCFCVCVWCFIYCRPLTAVENTTDALTSNTLSDQRITQAVMNCSEDRSIDQFPPDVFTEEQRAHGAIIVHLCIALYFFVVIAFVCNDYFLPSVYCICQDLHLSPDVAGATFMATATCFPELFVNIIGTFVTETDLGVGAIVGSGVFNTLGVAACAGLAASKDIDLERWPLIRDGGGYMLAVAVLLVILHDGLVQWYEALFLLILYFAYFILMFTQKWLHNRAKKMLRSKNSFNSQASLQSTTTSVLDYGTYRPYYFSDWVMPAEKKHNHNNNNISSTHNTSNDIEKKQEAEQEEVTPVCSRPNGCLLSLWWLFSLPVACVLSVSVPDCRKNRTVYPLTFLMCIFWIGISSYIVSWMMTIFGDTFRISDAVMGITFLAIGGSMPEAVSSVINARNGVGSMSLSNALGANTLDILLCLGLPWFIKTLLPATMGGGPIPMDSPGLTFNCGCLIISVVVLIVAALLNGHRMNRVFGVICLVMYTTFIAVTVLAGMNIIFQTEQDVCT